jgi:glucoamylase
MSEKNKMFTGTLKHIVSELMTDDYAFFRYRSDDGLTGDDNTFFLLSFWYAQVLILLKKYSEAKSVIDSLLEKGNHLGLFSEEYDVLTRELMGNFPQAITHLGIITSCVSLNNALNKEKMNEIMAT